MDKDLFQRREQLQRVPAMGCGLHRTTMPLRGHEQEVGPDNLVLLHDHRPEEFPFVALPSHCEQNRWWFAEPGMEAVDADFLEALIPLPDEGFYVLVRDVSLSDDPDDVLRAGALVMLGYDRKGNSLLYPALFEGLVIRFAERGYRFEGTDILGSLEAANFAEPEPPEERAVH